MRKKMFVKTPKPKVVRVTKAELAKVIEDLLDMLEAWPNDAGASMGGFCGFAAVNAAEMIVGRPLSGAE